MSVAAQGAEAVTEFGAESAAAASQPATAELAGRIASILDGAETLAAQIRTKARDEAATVLAQAHRTAAARVSELTREAERLREEAEAHTLAARRAGEEVAAAERRRADEEARALVAAAERDAASIRADVLSDAQATKSAAEAYAALQRRKADEHAEKTLASAENEARSLRAAAELELRRAEADCRHREEAAADQIRVLAKVREETVGAILAASIQLRETASQPLATSLSAARAPRSGDGRGEAARPRRLRRGRTIAPFEIESPPAPAPSPTVAVEVEVEELSLVQPERAFDRPAGKESEAELVQTTPPEPDRREAGHVTLVPQRDSAHEQSDAPAAESPRVDDDELVASSTPLLRRVGSYTASTPGGIRAAL